MASITLSGGSIAQQYPVGTSVGAYARSAKNGGGAPVGAAIVSAAVAADSTWTASHAGLVLGGLYTAYALVGGQHRYVDFAITQSDVAVRRGNGPPHGVGIKVVEGTFAMGTLAAVTAVDVNVALPAGSAKIGDIPVGFFHPTLPAHVTVQGMACVAADSVRVRLVNQSAAISADPADAQVTFAIIKV